MGSPASHGAPRRCRGAKGAHTLIGHYRRRATVDAGAGRRYHPALPMEPIRRPDPPGAPSPAATAARPAAPLYAVRPPLAATFREASRPLDAGDRPLAALVYGDDPAPAGAAALVIRVPLRRLGGAPVAEVWSGPAAAAVERRGAVDLAAAGPVAFAAVRADHTAGAALEPATAAAYRDLLAAVRAAGFPHLLRVWAVVPGINEEEGGLERYRRFCRARAEAIEEAYGPGFTAELSASTAVGGADEGLVVWALAARLPGRHRENPRQVAAYRYPAVYGPRSPSFARATACPEALGGQLLISGTAAIVGHRSLHPGSVVDQTRETLANLARLTAGRPAPPGLPFRQLKVYLRNAADRPAVESELHRALGREVPLLFLRADVCRRELEVEIEGLA
jgi:chorismate lyase / 3-hydroxybenzoate synthase